MADTDPRNSAHPWLGYLRVQRALSWLVGAASLGCGLSKEIGS
jgi:hypothetical protein